MTLYYHVTYNPIILTVYEYVDSTLKKVARIPCYTGDNILLVVEEYFEKNKIDIKFDELIAL